MRATGLIPHPLTTFLFLFIFGTMIHLAQNTKGNTLLNKTNYILCLRALFMLLIFLSMAVVAQDRTAPRPKLSPLTRKYLGELQAAPQKGKAPEGFLYKQDNAGGLLVSALIKVSDAGAAQAGLQAIGATVGTKAGNVWTVRVPYSKVPDFAAISSIAYIQMDEPATPHLDKARKTTRVDSVHSGINLPMAYSGKGVIVGVVDFGFDYNHPTFYDTLRASYRIKRVWEPNGTGTPPAGYSYGAEITDTNQIKARGTDNAEQTHGTCVAGMAAGSGFGSPTAGKFRGMAFDADLVMVGVRRDKIGQQWLEGSFTDFLDGISYIFNYAASVGKPCVVNISWGSQSGPHDGTTLLNEGFNNLTGPGKILVMSAGNEGEEKIHLSKNFTAADTTLNTFLSFSSPAYKRTWIDVWGEPGQTFCGEVTLYAGNVAGSTTGFTCIDDGIHNKFLISANGQDTCFVQFITSAAEYNGKPRITIDIYNKATDTVGISLKGISGAIHAWNEYYYYGYTYGFQSAFDNLKQSWAASGNTATTVSDMGAAESVLLVGAYASKVAFTSINGGSQTYSGYVAANRLVPFSSRGPLVDGTVKPDITAPGLTIATSVSSYDTAYTPTGSSSDLTVSSTYDSVLGKTFYYSEFTGTSASAPAASGIVALLLQKNKHLTPAEVKDIIATTAITDVYTGALPVEGNNNWGHGKINAYGAIKLVPEVTGIYSYTGEKLSCGLYPNPGTGLFTLRYTAEKQDKLNIEVYNIMGKQVLSASWHTGNGISHYPIDLSQMPVGAYLVKVISAQGFTTIRALLQ
jgi:minor extracellular serine protease Vpr